MDKLKILFFLKDENYVRNFKNNISIELLKLGIESELIFKKLDEHSFKEFLNFKYVDLIFFQFVREEIFHILDITSLIRANGYRSNINILFQKKILDEKVLMNFFEIGGSDGYYIEDILNKSIDFKFLTRDRIDIYKYLGMTNYKIKMDSYINYESLEDFFKKYTSEENLNLDDINYIYQGLDEYEKSNLIEKIECLFLNKKVSKIANFNGGGIISIFSNTEFACEFASIAANKSDKKIVLIDMDRVNPSMDLFLNKIDKKNLDSYFDRFSLFQVQEEFLKNKFEDENVLLRYCMKSKDDNLSFIFGTGDIRKFEYYSNEMIIQLIDLLSKKFDLVILNLNNFIYDAYTCIGIIKSDVCLIPIDINIEKLREYNRYIDFLVEKQNVDKDKFLYVFFEYNKKIYRELSFYSDLLKNKFLGSISFSRKRLDYRNYKKTYISVMKKIVKLEYICILKKLNVIKEN